MKRQERDHEEDLRHLSEAVAESVADMTEAEVLAEAMAEGVDVHAVAEELRGMAREIAREVRLRPLQDARRHYERERDALAARVVRLPASPSERRALLQQTLARKPELQPYLTAAARELNDLPDGDIESMLRQLAALGCIDDVGEQ